MAVEISAKTVKELRDKTSAGMMDCKKALQEADGDLEKAMESLRQKGLASANKKADRIATEGIIVGRRKTSKLVFFRLFVVERNKAPRTGILPTTGTRALVSLISS